MKFYFLFSYKFIIIHLIFTYKIKKIIIYYNSHLKKNNKIKNTNFIIIYKLWGNPT